jgi:polyisoprenoid-binding protein YceI
MLRSLRHFALLAALAIPTIASAETYGVDTSHSKATFRVKHFGVSWFWGQFHDLSGTVNFDAKNPTAGSLDLTIKADSLFTADKKRDDHLKSPDFFNTKQFPTITFKSKSVAQNGAKLTVTGDLTLHGVTKAVTADFEFTGEGKDPWGGYRAGWESKLSIKRSDYGMNFMQGGIGDDITIYLAIEGVKK